MRWEKDKLIETVKSSKTQTEVLSKLGLSPIGGNCLTLKKHCKLWNISISHFMSASECLKQRINNREEGIGSKEKIPLEAILIENSTFDRGALKRRLLKLGLKTNKCEMCGSGDLWYGKRMSMILDHINGVNNDHRSENLRMLCPNCNATLETYCAKNNRRPCPICSTLMRAGKKYCSIQCRAKAQIGRQNKRKVERPSYEVLKKEVAETSYLAVGRKYGVSDNAVHLWIKTYERKHD